MDEAYRPASDPMNGPARLSLERFANDIRVEGLERNPGCHAVLEDDGVKQKIPVCMGGTAIIGCNDYDTCHIPYGERINDPRRVHVIFQDDEGRVSHINTVPRAPLVPPQASATT